MPPEGQGGAPQVPVPSGPLTQEVIDRAKGVCAGVMKDPGLKQRDPVKQLAQGEILLNRILEGMAAQVSMQATHHNMISRSVPQECS